MSNEKRACGCCGYDVRGTLTIINDDDGNPVQVGAYCLLKINQLGFEKAKSSITGTTGGAA